MSIFRFAGAPVATWSRTMDVLFWLLGVFVTRTVVEVSGDRATAQLDVTLTGTSRWLPERVRALAVRVQWRRRQGQWKAVAASWQPLFGAS